MGKKINVAELLKDCPTGMELDCTCADNVVFDKIIEHEQIKCVIGECRDPLILDKYGRLQHICCSKCVIVPKGKTSWKGFVPPCQFKDGDVVATTNGRYIGITTGGNSERAIPTYCVIKISGEFEAYFGDKKKWMFSRFASEEEKQKLFQAIKDRGYKWNAETKTLEKLIEPKFRIGDIITNGKTFIAIGYIDDEYYYEINRDIAHRLCIKNQDEWELVPNKFDINTLKPFDKVLVRGDDGQKWIIDFFGFMDNKKGYPFVCVGHYVIQCIPYEGNEHLLGTSDECDEYYKTW